jgi:hypothetical protein
MKMDNRQVSSMRMHSQLKVEEKQNTKHKAQIIHKTQNARQNTTQTKNHIPKPIPISRS